MSFAGTTGGYRTYIPSDILNTMGVPYVPPREAMFSCDYCGSSGVGERCKSCGAPRTMRYVELPYREADFSLLNLGVN